MKMSVINNLLQHVNIRLFSQLVYRSVGQSLRHFMWMFIVPTGGVWMFWPFFRPWCTKEQSSTEEIAKILTNNIQASQKKNPITHTLSFKEESVCVCWASWYACLTGIWGYSWTLSLSASVWRLNVRVLFCLHPENEVIEETKHSYHKDFSHSLPDLKRAHTHTRHRRSTGETHTHTHTHRQGLRN